MLRALRTTAARSSRTSFSFFPTRKLNTAAALPTAKASAVRAPDVLPPHPDSFLFLRNFTSQCHGSSSDLLASSKADKNVASAHNSSSFVTFEARREISTSAQLSCDSKFEVSSASGSGNNDAVEAGLETKSQAESDEALDPNHDEAQLTDGLESRLSPDQESEHSSASESVFGDADDEEGDLSAGNEIYPDPAPEDSEEEGAIDMSKVPEDLKEMMDDSYVYEGVEEEFPSERPLELLTLDEVKQVLEEVRARDVKIFNVHDRCEWTDVMVVATGISDRHVRGIADALVFKIKKKENVESPLYPTIEGELGGKWLVVDCGNIVIHVLNEESREYYRLEDLWTGDVKPSTTDEDFESMLNRAGIKNAVP